MGCGTIISNDKARMFPSLVRWRLPVLLGVRYRGTTIANGKTCTFHSPVRRKLPQSLKTAQSRRYGLEIGSALSTRMGEF